jgi:hypothetical protein
VKRLADCLLISLALAALLSACDKSVVIESEFPEPLIAPLPLNVGVYYGPAITDYEYGEELPADSDWSFDLGGSNIKLFNTVFGALFDNMTLVDGTGGTGSPYTELDAVIEPTLEAFEFSLPRQSRTDQFAVWIRYNLRVYTPDGTLITNWPISAYGQSDAPMLGSEKAMARAAINAMRDAAASIVIGFKDEPKIKEALLREEANEES